LRKKYLNTSAIAFEEPSKAASLEQIDLEIHLGANRIVGILKTLQQSWNAFEEERIQL
jgi:hypothetical protein